jgi:DNA-binding MarR family transcriptional regulator
MPRKIPKKPRYVWKDILLALDDEYGTGEITSRNIANLLGITIHDASMRLRRFRGWGAMKVVRIGKGNSKVYVITNEGRRMIDHIKKGG